MLTDEAAQDHEINGIKSFLASRSPTEPGPDFPGSTLMDAACIEKATVSARTGW